MNKLKYILGFMMVMTIESCTDFVEPAIPYSGFDTGTFLRTISVSSDINYFALSSATFSLVIEAVDEQNGATVETVDIYAARRRGAAVLPEVKVVTLTASQFTSNAETKYLRASTSVTIPSVLTALGLTEADVSGGDFFEFRLVLTDVKGRTFSNNNLSSDIAGGGYYRSPFFYRIPVVCPSIEADWVGAYNSVSSGEYGNGSGGQSGSYSGVAVVINITKQAADADGVYLVSDMSFGMYPVEYGDQIPPGRIRDVCGGITDVGDSDRYGDPFTISGSRNPTTGVLTITWGNTWGDTGNAVLTPQ